MAAIDEVRKLLSERESMSIRDIEYNTQFHYTTLARAMRKLVDRGEARVVERVCDSGGAPTSMYALVSEVEKRVAKKREEEEREFREGGRLTCYNRPPEGWKDPVTGLIHFVSGVWCTEDDVEVWEDTDAGFAPLYEYGVPEVPPSKNPHNPQSLHDAMKWLRKNHRKAYDEILPEDPFCGDEPVKGGKASETASASKFATKEISEAVSALVKGNSTQESAVVILKVLRAQGVQVGKLAVLEENSRGEPVVRCALTGDAVAWVNNEAVCADEVRIVPSSRAPDGAGKTLLVGLAMAQGYMVVEPS